MNKDKSKDSEERLAEMEESPLNLEKVKSIVSQWESGAKSSCKEKMSDAYHKAKQLFGE